MIPRISPSTVTFLQFHLVIEIWLIIIMVLLLIQEELEGKGYDCLVQLFLVNVKDYEAFFLVYVNDCNVCFTFFRVNVFTSVSLSGKRYGSADRIIAVTYIQTVLI